MREGFFFKALLTTTLVIAVFLTAVPCLDARERKGLGLFKRNGDEPQAAMDGEGLRGEANYKEYKIVLNPFGFHFIDKFQEDAAEAGASWDRTKIAWGEREPVRGEFKIDGFRKRVSDMTSVGIDMAPRINSWNPWANTDTINKMNQSAKNEGKPIGDQTFFSYTKDIEGYKAFLTRVVEMFDGDGVNDTPELKKPIKYWQIENEWDWRWKDTPEKYVELMKAAHEAIKKADPEAKIILSGISELHRFAFADGYLGGRLTINGKTMTREQMRAEKGFKERYELVTYTLKHGKDYFDIADFHHYGAYEAMDGVVKWLRDKMREYGYEKPIWSMEMGGPYLKHGEKYTEAIQADEVVKYYAMGMGNGVEVLFWSSFMVTASYGPAFTNLAVIDKGRKKPAFYAYKLMTSKLKGASSVERVKTGNEDSYVFKFMKAGKPVYVAWNNKGESFKLDPGGKDFIITDINGRDKTVKGDKEILLGTSPVFVEIR
ncbi:MAG: hypothetical protein HY880_06855 [Deltaproteobacteria bacterium]|nr:hypothetical protein [Deltaproteobacteria bacterium]